MAVLKMDQPAICRAVQHYLNTLNVGNVLMTVLRVSATEDGEFRAEVEEQPHTRQEKALVFEQ